MRCEYSVTANSWCSPSSREISSLLKERPGIRPRFFNQKMEQKDPEKKMPSTQAKATSLCAKGESGRIHSIAHSAFCFTAGDVSIALNRRAFSSGSRTSLSIMSEYVSE